MLWNNLRSTGINSLKVQQNSGLSPSGLDFFFNLVIFISLGMEVYLNCLCDFDLVLVNRMYKENYPFFKKVFHFGGVQVFNICSYCSLDSFGFCCYSPIYIHNSVNLDIFFTFQLILLRVCPTFCFYQRTNSSNLFFVNAFWFLFY